LTIFAKRSDSTAAVGLSYAGGDTMEKRQSALGFPKMSSRRNSTSALPSSRMTSGTNSRRAAMAVSPPPP
jgi:hypothetical protein